MTSSRARACPTMTALVYETTMQDWLEDYPNLTSFEMILGPLVSDSRRVSKTTMMRALPLMKKFVQRGAVEGVLHSHRLEAALKEAVMKRSSLSGSLGTQAHHLVANHMLAVMKALRDYHRESHKKWDSEERAFPKSGFLRKQLSVEEMADVGQVLELMKAPASLSPSPPPPPLCDREDDNDNSIDVFRAYMAADPVPGSPADSPADSVFREYLCSTFSRPSTRASSVGSTVRYSSDDDDKTGAIRRGRDRKHTAQAIRRVRESTSKKKVPQSMTPAKNCRSEDLLVRPVCSSSENGKNPRVEVVAFVESESGRKKVHVKTMKFSKQNEKKRNDDQVVYREAPLYKGGGARPCLLCVMGRARSMRLLCAMGRACGTRML